MQMPQQKPNKQGSLEVWSTGRTDVRVQNTRRTARITRNTEGEFSEIRQTGRSKVVLIGTGHTDRFC